MRVPLVRRGFTLVELLVVIAIIGVLVALLLPAVRPRSPRMADGSVFAKVDVAIGVTTPIGSTQD